MGECHPALVGHDTPVGQFQIVQRLTSQPGYGGDVLQFKETDNAWYAIHRVWTLSPKQKRVERLNSDNPKDRVITNGCVNVDPNVYERLKDCCSTDTVIITR
jgi:hypothetical protein